MIAVTTPAWFPVISAGDQIRGIAAWHSSFTHLKPSPSITCSLVGRWTVWVFDHVLSRLITCCCSSSRVVQPDHVLSLLITCCPSRSRVVALHRGMSLLITCCRSSSRVVPPDHVLSLLITCYCSLRPIFDVIVFVWPLMFTPTSVCITPVSYTHLTLPTNAEV